MSAAPTAAALPHAVPTHKWLVALAVMLGATLEVLDTSIVNVALPHMQGSFSASVDEIAWVLTSYLVANGIMIPMTGWISARFGRKRYFLISVVAFVIASALCGAARVARSDGDLPPASRRRRRRDDPLVASHPDGDLSARGAAAGDGDVGDGPDGRADPGADARRLDHRQLELALELLHQSADRHARLRRWSRPSCTIRPSCMRKRGRRAARSTISGIMLAGAGPRPAANRARSRPARRLVRLAVGRYATRGVTALA